MARARQQITDIAESPALNAGRWADQDGDGDLVAIVGSVLGALATVEISSPTSTVLVVTSAWPTADRPALGVFIKRQVQSVIDRGIQCDVLFVRGYRSPLAYPLAGALLGSWNLRRPRRYRLVHAHGGEAAISARFFVRAPLLASYLGSDLAGAPLADGTVTRSWSWRARAVRAVARTAQATITKSAAMEELLPPGARSRNVVLPNGVDRELFSPQPRAQARAVLGWPEDERIVLFASASVSSPNKRFDLAQAACARAATRLDSIRLEVAESVEPERMPILMSAADCLLLTSVTEGSPNVVKEALACDLPVVATPVGDVPELLSGIRSCAVCDPSAQALGDAMVTILAKGERSDGREKTAHLSDGLIADRLISLYQDVTHHKL